MCAGDPAIEIGDAGDHCRPGLGRRVLVRTIVAARVEAQAAASCKAVMPRLRKYVSTRVRAIGCDMAKSRRAASGDPVCDWRPSRFPRRLRVRAGQAQEASRLVGDVAEVEKAAAFADDVEEIAMLAGRGVGPFAGGAAAGFRPLEPHEHRAARRVADVADQPVSALAPSVGEIVAAHRLGLARETARQFGSVAGHHAASRSPMRSIG